MPLVYLLFPFSRHRQSKTVTNTHVKISTEVSEFTLDPQGRKYIPMDLQLHGLLTFLWSSIPMVLYTPLQFLMVCIRMRQANTERQSHVHPTGASRPLGFLWPSPPNSLGSEQILNQSGLLPHLCQKPNTSGVITKSKKCDQMALEYRSRALDTPHRHEDALGKQKGNHLSRAFGFSQKDQHNNISYKCTYGKIRRKFVVFLSLSIQMTKCRKRSENKALSANNSSWARPAGFVW